MINPTTDDAAELGLGGPGLRVYGPATRARLRAVRGRHFDEDAARPGQLVPQHLDESTPTSVKDAAIQTCLAGASFGAHPLREPEDHPRHGTRRPPRRRHPEAGRRQSAAPPPTKKILHLLPQLADLPKEAEEEGKTVDELRMQVRKLQLAARQPVPPAPTTKTSLKVIERDVVKAGSLERIERYVGRLEASEGKFAASLEAERDRLAQSQKAVALAITGLRDAIASSARSNASAPLKATSMNGTLRVIAVIGAPPPVIEYDLKGWTEMEEELYQKFKARLVSELRQEAPALLRLVLTAPEMEVEIRREVVEADGKTNLGRVARLLHEGWFDRYQTAIDTSKQINSTGAPVDRRAVLDAIDKLVSMGFLVKTTNGYKAVAGMKVNVKEAR